ncbi:MAG: T9SS type A sorting domain-containing protein [Bacteroidetes bacterium]|nr:T9SS type A sorting domain-containing protein [Bacteroidota bacterium]
MLHKILVSLAGLFCICYTEANAQSFFSNSGDSIHDNQQTCLPIVVSGLPGSTDSSFGICTVCFSINHANIGNLDVSMVSPAGDTVKLINNQGGTGTSYQGTCLSNSGITQIANGSSPFSNTYIPENSLNYFNTGQNPNGTWFLCVKDEVPTAEGYIVYGAILFCSNPPNDSLAVGPCGILNGNSCVCPDGSSDCDLLPDMTASADIIQAEHTEFPGLLTLSNATPNIGWGPMEIHSSGLCYCDTVSVPCSTTICPDGNPPTEKLLQRIYHKNGASITSYDTLTGATMSYHPTHGHIHINNWSWFTLRTPTSNPDATTWPIVKSGSKVSFCLVNLGDCTNNPGYCRDSAGNILTMNDIPNAPFGEVSGCGMDQGIYTGKLDIYGQALPDMNIDLTGVCNGNYYLVSITDPDNNFIESNNNNNWVAVPVSLNMQSSAITSSFSVSISGSAIIASNNNSDLTGFIWDFGDGHTDTINNPATHTYSAPGTYTITLTQTNPCGSYTTTQTIVITGIEESSDYSQRALKVYPNPTQSVAEITHLQTSAGKCQLSLLNLNGEVVYAQAESNVQRGWNSFTLDFEQLGISQGVYIVRLISDERTLVTRLVYQH